MFSFNFFLSIIQTCNLIMLGASAQQDNSETTHFNFLVLLEISATSYQPEQKPTKQQITKSTLTSNNL